MNTVVIVIHSAVSISLIFAILLHSGKGTGLSASIGGGFSTFAGTSMMEKYLDRITIVLSAIFVVTTLYLVLFYK